MESKIISVPAKTSHYPRQSAGKTILEKITTYDRDSVAMVEVKSESICTYGELASSSISLAASLQNRLKITKNTNLAIVSENSHKFCVVFLSALYLAAPIHLLNPGSTIYELKKFLMMSKPKVVFSSKKVLSKILTVKEEHTFIRSVVLLDDDGDSADVILYRDLIENQNFDFDFEKVDDVEDQVAFIANSSGTTGFPKGAMITHENILLNLSHSEDKEFYSYDRTSVASNIIPFYHVHGCALCYAGFYLGLKLIVMDQFLPQLFLESIQKHKVNKIFIVPTLGDFLANSPMVDSYDLSSVDDILSAAGNLKNDTQEKILRKFRVKSIRQIYGLTEIASAAFITPTTFSKPESCGRLTPGHSVKIVDPNTSEPVGCNQTGEIWIKGAVMKGYVNDSENTREAFDSDGFIRTGDIAYYDEDGYFYLIDRLKDLIKYKSLQVAPVEIEDILLQHPGIVDAAVVGKPDDRYGELPVAFVVKKAGTDLEEGDVVEHVAKYVCAEKRLHGGVRFVGEIPKNNVGKILRKELRSLL